MYSGRTFVIDKWVDSDTKLSMRRGSPSSRLRRTMEGIRSRL